MNACKPFAIFRRGVKTLKFYWGAGRELLKMLQGSMKKRCYLCRKPDTIEVQQMKAQAREEKMAKQQER